MFSYSRLPTSATAQASTQQNQLDATGGIDLVATIWEFGVDLADNIINDLRPTTPMTLQI
ncbi:hypothetical protein DPMN_012614 [Dreissena polymorpha]|uniref:Uncharacterized protein n=1 Tax=Dreissena polymorpha TaxID=45954 RepID=A0A9D4N5V4_DREPO|nr:hypothetical protein DPMN_012614 [Dreissena polymorpha]